MEINSKSFNNRDNDLKITTIEKLLCSIFRFCKGSTKCPAFIVKRSALKYGRKDTLRRYWYKKYKNISIGKYTYGFQYVEHIRLKKIGAFCSIADKQKIVPNDHRMDWVTTSPILGFKDFGFINENLTMKNITPANREVVIGNDVWIGANCIIFEGVKIGDGAVIAAGSIIRRDVPPYALVASVDKIIKYRFSKEIIDKLLKIQWWNWTDEKIKENLNLLYNPEEFVNKFYKED